MFVLCHLMLPFSRSIVFPFISKSGKVRSFSTNFSHDSSNKSEFEWPSGVCPPNYWDDAKNHKQFLDWASNKLNIKDQSDWYKITQKDLKNLGASGLLSKYKDSPADMLTSVYPEFEWLPWKFTTQKTYLDNVENQKKFLEWAGKQLNVKELDDWYKFSKKDIQNLCEIKSSLSLAGMLMDCYPEHNWLPWKFEDCPKKYWDDVKNHRKFIEWVATQLNIKEQDDWYKVSAKNISDLGGSGLLSKYENSFSLLISSIFREWEWLPWKFGVLPKPYWDDLNNQKRYLDWAAKELGITDYNGWFKTPRELGPMQLSHNLRNVISAAFEGPSSQKARKIQGLLKAMIQVMFPNQEMQEDYNHPDLVSPVTKKNYRLDFYFPKIKLAIDFLSEKHFSIDSSNSLSLQDRKNDAAAKYDVCRKQGISLIQVPYWWDKDIENLATTIFIERPELFTQIPTGKPISSTQPAEREKYKTDDEAIIKKSLMTATQWEEGDNPKGWWMQEKFDGMRLLWNGSDFYTRKGNKLKVPEFVATSMPKIVLDGELWTQYGLYQESVQLSQNSGEEKWKKAIYWVFDAPEIGDKPYEERLEYMQEMKKSGQLPEFVQIIESIQCQGPEHLKEYFKAIVAKGGEGVMLREPHSIYKQGRSKSLRKYKEYFDTEVRVVENAYPHGFNCEQQNGKALFVNIHDNYQDAKAVKVGSVITVKHMGVNIYGTLQYPKFFRLRSDVTWDDVLQQQQDN